MKVRKSYLMIPFLLSMASLGARALAEETVSETNIPIETSTEITETQDTQVATPQEESTEPVQQASQAIEQNQEQASVQVENYLELTVQR